MRTAFIQAMTGLAASDPNVVLVVGDLGFSVVESYRERFPSQYLNAGVAEQNMTGLAAGLAMAGKRVFTYSIANFPTLRCVEQVRNDVCYHNANVTVVSVGGGLAYGSLGPSHHASEDMAVMRSLPGMRVVCPGDPVEAREATLALGTTDGPGYLRLSKTGEPVIHQDLKSFEIGRAIPVRAGRQAALLATGAILENALKAAEMLAAQGLDCQVWSFHTVKPLDASAVLQAAQTGHVVTVEEHSILGGLGSAVAEVLAEAELPRPVRFRRLGLRNEFCPVAGSQNYLRKLYGLHPEGLAASVSEFLAKSIAKV
ncbi:MAG: transketolase C-terminal domain-containing protein [Candidatus Eremiobacterota bacterium]